MNKIKLRKCVWLPVLLAAICFMVVNAITYSYAEDSTFRHKRDEINMTENKVTYYYMDNRTGRPDKRSYTIQDDWLSQMKIHHQKGEFDEGSDTDTTMYGPYVWLPAGKYKIRINFTRDGGSAFEQYDVCINFGRKGSATKPYNYSGRLEIGNGAYISNQTYVSKNPNDKYLEYTIETDGNASDYEFRLFFNGDLGTNLGSGANNDINVLHKFVRSVTVTAEYDNTISLDTNGGSVTKNTAATKWGQQRGKLSSDQIPSLTGYTFEGYYGYSLAENTTSSRSGLTFNNKSELVKLWNADGTAATGAEISYNDYTVYAQWKANPDTPYKVEHYKQKVDGTYPSTPDETESKTGTTGSEVTPPVKTYTGFTSPSAQKVTIAADGSTVVKYYYKRNNYSLTFDWDIGVSGVTGHNNDENDIGIDKNKQYFYTYGKTEPSFIFFNNGYEFDYVEEKTPGHEQNHWSNDGTGTDNYGRFYLRENWSIQAYNRTFYIHTKPKIYKLYFEANGGTIPSDGNMGINGYLSPDRTNGNVTVTYNAPNYYLMGNDNPTREGYTFTGWYRPYWNEQGVCYKNELIYDAYGNAVESSIWHYDNEEHKYNEVHYQLTSGETLYANWKAIIYLKIILAKLLSIWYKH